MFRSQSLLVGLAVVIALASSPDAKAGIFGHLFKKRCCQPATTCPPAACEPCEAAPDVTNATGPPVCMTNPPLPPGSSACAVRQQYCADVRCIFREHQGHPTVIEAALRAALRRYQFSMGMPVDVVPTSFDCNCGDCFEYGCDPDADYDEYYNCLYNCMYSCMDECYGG